MAYCSQPGCALEAFGSRWCPKHSHEPATQTMPAPPFYTCTACGDTRSLGTVCGCQHYANY